MLSPLTKPTTVFTCTDTFTAMMSCIYDAWSSRLGHSNIRLMTEPIGNFELFAQYISIPSDIKKSNKVMTAIQSKISTKAYIMVYQAAMSCNEEKLDAIYRFLIAGFHYGPCVTDYLKEPVVIKILQLSRAVSNEAHAFIEFLRFENKEHNVLVSHIEPKNNILTLIAPHFADRLPSENWMIIDDVRNLCMVHPADTEYYMTTLTNEEKDHLSKQTDDPFIDLWKGFFEHIAIPQRKNPQCQRNMLPLWYRKHMTEFKL